MRRFILSLGGVLVLWSCLGPFTASATGTTSTFTLDALSFISFGDQEVLLLPPGSTIQFQFGTPAPDGTVPFTVSSAGVSIAAVEIPSSPNTLQYSLAGSSSGLLSSTVEGKSLVFTATVRATLSGPEAGGSFDYTMPFSTETVSAQSADGSDSETVTGLRLVDGVWYGQIVGATTNETNAFPAPGTAVYTVLSGSFDQIPLGN